MTREQRLVSAVIVLATLLLGMLAAGWFTSIQATGRIVP